jgi:hypothetical protein
MKKPVKKVARAAKRGVQKAYAKAETRVMAAVGRKAVKMTMQEAKVVGRKAASAALKAGAVAAAGVVLREVRRPKRLPPA